MSADDPRVALHDVAVDGEAAADGPAPAVLAAVEEAVARAGGRLTPAATAALVRSAVEAAVRMSHDSREGP